MVALAPCPSCQRHVRTSETACPFCRATVDFSGLPPPVRIERRLARNALVALAAALGAGSMVDCSSSAGGPVYGGPYTPYDASSGDASDAGSDSTGD